MILKCFALHDAKAGFFNVPFYLPSIGQAVRSITDLVSDVTTIVSRHPGDFSLYHLGDWDDATGRLIACEPPLHIANCEQLVPPVGFSARDEVR